ncbi:MAG: arsenate reductase/protein-tyrosine-phosphatase family protein [Sporichthyaceae bacterium]|jgi:protein-tyrosine phosphatase
MTIDAQRFSILFVCTGNICRSPFAEILTRHLLAERGAASWCTVSSAGADAVVGAAMHPTSRAELAAWGLDGEAAESFVARQLERDLLAGADLVLGASAAHRAGVVRMWPGALATAFGVLEFARLLGGVGEATLPAEPIARARRLVALARANRGMAPPGPSGSDEIPDPISGPALAHTHAARIASAALAEIVHALAPGGRSVPSPRSGPPHWADRI